MSKLTEIYDAVWATLEEHGALTVFLEERGGHKFKRGAHDKLPVKLAKSDLPALLVTPVSLSEDVVLSGYIGEQVRFQVEMLVWQRDLDVLFEFVEHVGDALKEKLRGADANLGLSYVCGIDLSSVEFEQHESESNPTRGGLWTATRTINVQYYDAIPT